MGARFETEKRKEFLLTVNLFCFRVFEINKKRFLAEANTKALDTLGDPLYYKNPPK